MTVTWSVAVSCQLHKLLLITHCELRIVSSSSIWTEGVIQNHYINLCVIQDHSAIFSCELSHAESICTQKDYRDCESHPSELA